MNSFQLEGRFERSLNVTGRVTLDVSTNSGAIRVSIGGAGSVQVRGIVRASKSLFLLGDPEARLHELEINPPVEQNDNDIRGGYISDGWFSGHTTLLLDIKVQRDASVRAQADSGNIWVEGVQGPVDCYVDSGDVELFNIGAAVRAEADSGTIQIRQVAGSVHAETDAGEIQAIGIGGTINARADSGSIHVPELNRTDSSRNEVFGQIRGGGPSVDVEVDSGNIDIE